MESINDPFAFDEGGGDPPGEDYPFQGQKGRAAEVVENKGARIEPKPVAVGD